MWALGQEARLPLNGAHVWYRCTTSCGSSDLAAALAVLSPGERLRYERFVFEDDGRDYALAHGLLRQVLSLYDRRPASSWCFDSVDGRKPVVAGRDRCPVSFNLSHTRGCVACAVAAGVPVGVDVERIDQATSTLEAAARYFSPCEVAHLGSLPDSIGPTRFVELWTLKEAYLKAIGMGLAHPLDTFGFDVAHPPALRFEPPPHTDATQWHFALFAVGPDRRAAVALRRTREARCEITTIDADAGTILAPICESSADIDPYR